MAQRDLEFDGLRGLAALAVVGCHLSKLCVHWRIHEFDFWQGACGAHLLIIASGFGMGATLSRTPTMKQFIVERIGRVYPLYATSIVFSASLILIFEPPLYRIEFTQLLANMTMLQSWLGQEGVDDCYWLTGVLLKFYILMSLVIWTGLHRRFELTVVLYLVGVGCWRVAIELGLALPSFIGRLGNVQHAHLFIAGMLLWIISRQELTMTRALAFVTCMGLEAAGTQMPWGSAVVIGILLLCFCRHHAPWLGSPPLVHLGGLAFAIYMLHGVLSYVVMSALYTSVPSRAALIAISLAVVLGVSELFHQGIERSMRTRLRGLSLPRGVGQFVHGPPTGA